MGTTPTLNCGCCSEVKKGCCKLDPQIPLCYGISSDDGCKDCFNGKQVQMTYEGGTWSGAVSASCGILTLSIKCNTKRATCCTPSVLLPSEISVTMRDEGGCACCDGVNATMSWNEGSQTWSGTLNLTACNTSLTVTMDTACNVHLSGCASSYSSKNVDSCSPFQLSVFGGNAPCCNGVVGSWKLVIEAPSQDPASGSCENYQLTVTCGKDTVTVPPSNCRCGDTGTGTSSQFLLEFGPITLTDCCQGTISVDVLECPQVYVDCPDCLTVPKVWKLSASGFEDADCSFCSSLNGDHTLIRPIDYKYFPEDVPWDSESNSPICTTPIYGPGTPILGFHPCHCNFTPNDPNGQAPFVATSCTWLSLKVFDLFCQYPYAFPPPDTFPYNFGQAWAWWLTGYSGSLLNPYDVGFTLKGGVATCLYQPWFATCLQIPPVPPPPQGTVSYCIPARYFDCLGKNVFEVAMTYGGISIGGVTVPFCNPPGYANQQPAPVTVQVSVEPA
jgi:hypothetical protein